MSAASAWSHTGTATLWALLGRNDLTGVKTYAAPVAFACDYSAEAKRVTDARGMEFTTRQIVYTERDDITPGDMVVIGASSDADPIAAGAFEVRAVTRDADTFDGVADDYTVFT